MDSGHPPDSGVGSHSRPVAPVQQFRVGFLLTPLLTSDKQVLLIWARFVLTDAWMLSATQRALLAAIFCSATLQHISLLCLFTTLPYLMPPLLPTLSNKFPGVPMVIHFIQQIWAHCIGNPTEFIQEMFGNLLFSTGLVWIYFVVILSIRFKQLHRI